MTEAEIQRHLALYVFEYRRYLCVPNSNQFLDWEADLLVLSPSDWLYEIEIKSTLSDLKADIKKHKHNFVWGHSYYPLVWKMYYAMPLSVFEKVRDAPPIPNHAGIITIDESNEMLYERAKRQREAKPNPSARKLTDQERYKLARLGALRYWCRQEAAA